MVDFLKFGGFAIGAAIIVGTSLGFLINFIVSRTESSKPAAEDAIASSMTRAMSDIRERKFVQSSDLHELITLKRKTPRNL